METKRNCCQFTEYQILRSTLQVLNNNNLYNFDVVFKDLFPVDLSTIPFDVTGSDNDFFTASATFRYLVFDVREKASSMRIRR